MFESDIRRGDISRLCAEAELILHFYPDVSGRQIERLRIIVGEVRLIAAQTSDPCSRGSDINGAGYAGGAISKALLARFAASLVMMYLASLAALLIIQWLFFS